MPLPRFRIRTLMIAVAVVALTMVALKLRQRSQEFSKQAKVYAFRAALYESGKVWIRDMPRASETFPATARHYRRESMRYARAARYPWLSVTPDRPLPE